MLAAAPALAQETRPRPFMLMNLGPAAVVAVEIAAAGGGTFGSSLIGRIALPAGNALHLTPPAGSACRSDVRVRFEDGRIAEYPGEDLCQAQRVLRVAPPAP